MNDLLNELVATRVRLDTPTDIALLAVLVSVLVVFGIARWRISATQTDLRPIAGFTKLMSLPSGGAFHVSPGTGGLNDSTMAETLAGLDVVDSLVTLQRQGPVVVTSAEGLTFAATHSAVRRSSNPAATTRFIAPEPLPYTVGVTDVVRELPADGNVTSIVAGVVGDEFLHIGERVARLDSPPVLQITGTAQPRTLAASTLVSDHTLTGEELFAARAYLTRSTPHVASLLVQDLLRLVLILTVIVLAVLRGSGLI